MEPTTAKNNVYCRNCRILTVNLLIFDYTKIVLWNYWYIIFSTILGHLHSCCFLFLDFHRPISVKSGGDFKSRFEILEELGKGRFGVVYRVQEREDSKQILAAKVIKCIKAQDRQKVMEEISIMKSLQHPKLLQLAASFESAREIVMVME